MLFLSFSVFSQTKYHFCNLCEHENFSGSDTKIYAGKTKTWGYTFVISSRGWRSALSPWKDVWCGSATAQLQWNLFHFISIFLSEAFWQYWASGSTAGNYRHTTGNVPTNLMSYKRRKQNCLYMGEAKFTLFTVDFFLRQQWETST